MEIIYDTNKLSPGAMQLLITAEQLIAEKGIDGVSSRALAKAAGHKNHSAVNYNFGSYEGLVEALIDYRVGPINDHREILLEALLKGGAKLTVASLVELMIRPLANELLQEAGESRYLSLIAQLLSRGHWRELFMRNRARSSALIKIAELLRQALPKDLPSDISAERIRLLGNHIIFAVAEWDSLYHSGQLELSAKSLDWRIKNLVEYTVGGLTAAHNKIKG